MTAPEPPSEAPQPAGIVVLVSGSGTNLQALIDAASDPAYGVRILAVGADRDGIAGLARAERAGMPPCLSGAAMSLLIIRFRETLEV